MSAAKKKKKKGGKSKKLRVETTNNVLSAKEIEEKDKLKEEENLNQEIPAETALEVEEDEVSQEIKEPEISESIKNLIKSSEELEKEEILHIQN